LFSSRSYSLSDRFFPPLCVILRNRRRFLLVGRRNPLFLRSPSTFLRPPREYDLPFSRSPDHRAPVPYDLVFVLEPSPNRPDSDLHVWVFFLVKVSISDRFLPPPRTNRELVDLPSFFLESMAGLLASSPSCLLISFRVPPPRGRVPPPLPYEIEDAPPF